MKQIEKLRVHCPVCGRELGKSGKGTNTEQSCSKCKSILNYDVGSDTVCVRVVWASDKQKVS